MSRSLRSLWARVRRRARVPAAAPEGPRVGRTPGRAHLVFEDGSVAEARLDPADQARVEYLARRAAPPPPPSKR